MEMGKRMSDKELMQAFFDKAVGAVVAQGKPSMNETSCLYRGPDGTKCVIGHMLTDEQLSKYAIVENSTPESWGESILMELLPCEHMSDAQNFMSLLQEAHDDAGWDSETGKPHDEATFVRRFLIAANDVAARYELTPYKAPTV